MYKSIDFEYDLWKTSDDKCFARVKSTGEVCEISSDTMKLLRCEEKRIYRELALKKSLESENVDEKTKASIRYPLSFDVCDDESEELSAKALFAEQFTPVTYIAFSSPATVFLSSLA